MKEIIQILKKDRGISKLIELGKIYLVGGFVRDSYLGKESKDVDLLITGIPLTTIAEILRPFGNVDEVGQSFGVVKYTPKNWIMNEPIDIAIPRTEKLKKGGKGHTDFEITSDPNLPIETDLLRRDFCLNSIAVDFYGNVIDLFGGVKDIEDKIIRMTNPDAFSDDSLRILRGIGQSSRFGFKIEDTTWKSMVDNHTKITTISGERILEELDKIYYKGNRTEGIRLFIESGLSTSIFKHKTVFNEGIDLIAPDILSRADFYAVICSSNPDKFRNVLKGDVHTGKTIKAIRYCFEQFSNLGENLRSEPHHRIIAYDALNISDSVGESGILPSLIKKALLTLDGITYPRVRTDLAINGDDVRELGFEGKEIGDTLQLALQSVMFDQLPNDKDVLLEIIKRKKLKK
jgi:tRNA nucleotidyltransferase/poly(A) polymerase